MDWRSGSGRMSGSARALRPEDLQPRYLTAATAGRSASPRSTGLRMRLPRGVCVLLNGQTEFIEKYGRSDRRAARRAASPWQRWTGAARADLLRALDDPLKAHIADFAQYNADLQLFMDKVVRNLTDRPPMALAHSMGAHILLRALHERPRQFSAAVLLAPMLRVQTRGYPVRLARLMCRAQNLAGRRRDGWSACASAIR